MSSDWGHAVELIVNRFFGDGCNEFRKLSCEMKMFYCYKNLDIRRTLLQWINDSIVQISKAQKSSTLSGEFREKGNQKFKTADDEASLILYSKSVIYAPYGSAELSLALGNRSAVLFRLQKYKECVLDIDFATKNFNNSSLYPKLLLRKIRSLSRLKQHTEALQCLNDLRKFVAQKDDFSSIRKHVEECANELNQISDKEESIIRNIHLPELFRGENRNFSYASNALELELNSELDDRHRRVLARETIELGDVILVEEPFSFVLLPGCSEEHCQFCCKPLLAPVACLECVACLYCNYECMEKAQTTHHRWECKGLSFLQNLGVGHLALRTFLLTTQNPNSAHCKQIDELVTHVNDIPEADMLSYILTSTLLTVYLEECTNFVTTYDTLTAEGIGFSIFKSTIQIICNAFAIKKPSDGLSLVTYATGMFPSAAMMNHSCEPNIVTSFCNNTLVVRANRRIEQGEEVFNCYGPHFRRMNKQTRKQILRSQFFFDCKCKHCVSDRSEDNADAALCVCLDCRHPFDLHRCEGTINCSSCSATIDIRIYLEFVEQMINLRERGIQRVNVGDYEKACRLFEQCGRLQKTFLETHSKAIFDNTMDLAECYYKLGDYENSWKNFYSNIAIANKYFDEFDAEFAALISRTIDAFLSQVGSESVEKMDNEVEKLLSLLDKMTKAAEMNFGAWSQEYVSLLEKTKTLMNFTNKRESLQFDIS